MEATSGLAAAPASQEDAEVRVTPPLAPDSSGLLERTGFSTGPDLRVVIEGQDIPVYSQVLMLASPVFQQMLSTGMKEGIEGQVELKDESREEFDVFWSLLVHRANLTTENVTFLSVWADKYQIEGLRDRCERFIIDNLPISCAGLEHAVKYKLPSRTTQCADSINSNIGNHIVELSSLGSQVSAETMQLLWLSICAAAGIEDLQMPDDLNPAHSMWPFIEKSVTAMPLARAAKAWPQMLYDKLARGPDLTARSFLQEELQKFQLGGPV